VSKPADAPALEDQPSDSAARRPRLLAPAFSVGVVIVILAAFVLVLPSIVSYRDVWLALRGMSPVGLAVVVVAAAINLLTYGPALWAVVPGLPYPSAMAATLASSASTYVAPGGPTVGLGVSYVMLRAWGFRRQAITLALSLVTVWGQLTTLSLPLLAFGFLALSGGRNPLLERIAPIGFVLFLGLVLVVFFVLRSGEFACWAGNAAAAVSSRILRLLRKPPVTWSGEQFAAFRREALGLVRLRWHWLTAGTYAGHLGVYLVLVVTLLALGVETDEVSPAESFAAFALVRLLGSIPIFPGGLGIVEVGLTTALVGFGGDEAEVVAAVLVFRFMTLVVPLVCGGLAGMMWRRYHPGEKLTAG
jgi:uncharacterized membrane protein YbhN (UPF0104 family)